MKKKKDLDDTITKESLKARYSEFNDAYLLDFASKKEGMIDVALEALKDELNERNIEANLEPETQASIFSKYIPKVSSELQSKYPNAKRIFGMDQKLGLRLLLLYLALGSFIFYINSGRSFGIIHIVGIILFLLGVYIYYNSKKRAILIIFEDVILFKAQKFNIQGIFSFFDIIKSYSSDNYFEMRKSDIRKVIVSEKFLSREKLCIIDNNGEKFGLIANTNKKYLQAIAFFLKEEL